MSRPYAQTLQQPIVPVAGIAAARAQGDAMTFNLPRGG
jgi:hypothetical protein